MDEETRRELIALTARPLSPVVDLTELDADLLDAAARDAARIVWARRIANETASVEVARRLVRTSAALDLGADVTNALARLEQDEQLHAELSIAFAERLGPPFAPRIAPLAPLATEPAEASWARQVLTALCVCESVSAERYAAVREHTDVAPARAVIDVFLRDEVVHAKLGFVLVPDALDRLRSALGEDAANALVEAELSMVFRELDATIGLDAERKGMPEAGDLPAGNPGVVTPATDALAFYDAIEGRIVPRLEACGIPASRLWRMRWD